jgi:hypothetical protein
LFLLWFGGMTRPLETNRLSPGLLPAPSEDAGSILAGVFDEPEAER